MGNNQSSPSRHNRLSKPKTNTNSPPALVVDSPESFRYADLSAKGRQKIKDVLLSPVETESAAAWSNKDGDAVGERAHRGRGRPLSLTSRSNSRVNSRSNSLSFFGSRRGSRRGSTAKLADPQSSKLSLVSNTQVDMEAAIRLLQEVRKTASPEDLAALHEALGPSTEPPASIAEPESGRTTSVKNSSLTRRRSLIQTPGLATRTTPIEGRRRTWNSWKAQHIAPEEEAKWNFVNRRAALETVEDSQDAPTARAQTPGDLDYSQLGSLKIGSLSIVNATPPAPSPALSSKSIVQRKPLAANDDYFTVAPDAGPSPLAMKYANRRGHVKSHSSVLPAPTPLYNNMVELDVSTDRGTAHTANQYAEDYQSDLPNSPFATAHTFGTANALANTVFDAPTTAIDAPGSSLFTATSPDSLAVPAWASDKASDQRTTKSGPRPTPRTSDSGYSSGGSLRAANRSPQSAEAAHAELASLDIVDKFEQSSGYVVSPTSITSAASKSFVDGTSSTQRRLQKQRKSQLVLPTVQSCQSSFENVIPDIPDTVKANFNQRLSHQPGMDALSQTYPSKDYVTIDSTSTDYIILNTQTGQQDCLRDDRQPAVPEFCQVVQLTELEPDRPPTPPPHGRRRSRSLFRRKSKIETAEVNADSASHGIVDLGTIASSLGSSPYDAAMSRPLRQSITSPTHPHQLGATLPRSKSMVHMDADAAAEFARMRSKDRAFIEQEGKPHQRSRSFHNLRMEAGEARASKRYLKSFLHDAPPVPTIDSSHLGVYLQGTVSPTNKKEQDERTPLSARPRLESATGQGEKLTFSTSSGSTDQRVSQTVSQYDQHETVNWEAHAQHWRQRRKSIGEGLRSDTGFGEASTSTINSRNMPQPRHQLVDRYSGGLQYGYEGGGSFHGSAGTRQLHSAASSKSLQWRNQYGVDLSDVPIMLQHQRA